MIEPVLAELCVASRLAAEGSEFTLVFHAEGLGNDRIFGLLRDFGRETSGDFRPTLACITPLCPMYGVDPWVDPLRVNVPKTHLDRATVADFACRISELSEYFEIGYHGHFYRDEGDYQAPSFTRGTVLNQFEEEYLLLTDIGFRPRAYAGGWWFITPWLVSKLEEKGFELDTTLNDARKQYFLGPQPYAPTTPGEAFWIGDKELIEIPSLRRVSTIFKDVVVAGRRRRNFVALALHDYNLLDGIAAANMRMAMRSLAKREKILSGSDLANSAKEWLRGKGHNRLEAARTSALGGS